MVDLPLASRGQVAARIFNEKIGPNVLTTYDEFKAHVLHDFPDKRFEITIYRIYSLLRINGNKRKGDYCMGTDLKKNLLQFDAKFKLVNDGEAHAKDRLFLVLCNDRCSVSVGRWKNCNSKWQDCDGRWLFTRLSTIHS